ncbi:MAG: hypothetical protein K2X39_00600, partial [Silvanigrellaceae bacterium]|nr:hypothetical protein [Silvanigrellaceae bacterium]
AYIEKFILEAFADCQSKYKQKRPTAIQPRKINKQNITISHINFPQGKSIDSLFPEEKVLNTFPKIIAHINKFKNTYHNHYCFSREELKEILKLFQDLLSGLEELFDNNSIIVNKVSLFINQLNNYIVKEKRIFQGYITQNMKVNDEILKSHKTHFFLKSGNESDLKTKKTWIAKENKLFSFTNNPDEDPTFTESQKYIEAISSNIFRIYIGNIEPKYKVLKDGSTSKYYVFSQLVKNFCDKIETISKVLANYSFQRPHPPRNLAKIILSSIILAENDLKIGNLALVNNSIDNFDFVKIDHDRCFYPIIAYEKKFKQNDYNSWCRLLAIDEDDLKTIPVVRHFRAYNYLDIPISQTSEKDQLRSDVYQKIAEDKFFLKEKYETISKIIFIHPKIIEKLIMGVENIDSENIQGKMYEFFLMRYEAFIEAVLNFEEYIDYLKKHNQMQHDLELTKKEVIVFFSENPKLRNGFSLPVILNLIQEAYNKFIFQAYSK